MDPNFVEKTQHWIQLDNEATKLKDELAEITSERKELEEYIIDYVEQNDLGKVTLNVSDGNIKFPQRTQQQSISLKYLKETLGKYNETIEHIDVDAVYKFLVDNLETKKKYIIKRTVL